MNVSILRPVELYDSRTILGVVPEVKGIASLGHVDDVLAVEGVVGDHVVDGLLDAQALGVVNEGGGGAGLAHLLELASVLPGVGPGAVAQRIANVVVSNRCTVILGKLVLPVAVSISIGNRLLDRAHRAGGVSVTLLGQDVAAPVVSIHPGSARGAAGGVVLVVDPGQLSL